MLWSKTLYSSLWVTGSKETRLLWITLLMLKNSDGIIQAPVVGLADAAKLTPDECREALKVLLSPDLDDSSKVEGGRRIREVPGGWQIVNHDLYRFSTEAKREHWRAAKAEQRAREKQPKKPKKKDMLRVQAENDSRQNRHEKADQNGDYDLADRIAAENLPGGAL